MRYLLFYISFSCVFLPGADAMLGTRGEVMETELELALDDLVDNLWEDLSDFLHEVNAAFKCNAGTYYNSTTKKCEDCPAGQYSIADQTSCTPCPEGFYNPRPGRGFCNVCSEGTCASGTGNVNCTTCRAGYISDEIAAANCTACPLGEYSNADHFECMECKAGTYSDAPSDVCTPCPPGTVSDTGARECTACDPNTHPDAHQEQCVAKVCVPGERRGEVDGSCVACPPGSFSWEYNASTCTACSAGTYNSRSNQTSCVPCTPGTCSNYTGAVVCEPCSAGQYANKAGSLTCTACAKGSYQNEIGGVSCTLCRDKQTYTTYSSGSKSPEDCQGPLLRYVINNKPTELTDAESITVGEVDTLELIAVSGDWAVRNPEHPYSEFHVLKQGKKSIVTGVLTKILVEPMMTNVFCYKDTEGHGQYFSGYQRKDEQGRKCETPCRNAAGVDTGPHCHVNGEVSSCGIPKCIWDVECSAGDGTGYRGLASYVKLEGGELVPCQAWNKDYPHLHPQFHPTSRNIATYGLGHHNHCRNPDPGKTHSPWCYTVDLWVRWNYCSVSTCDAIFPYFEH